nr:hypothetical protein [Tanacetum cinerariifolium]
GYTYPVFVRCLDKMGTPTQHLCDYGSGCEHNALHVIHSVSTSLRQTLLLQVLSCEWYSSSPEPLVGMM